MRRLCALSFFVFVIGMTLSNFIGEAYGQTATDSIAFVKGSYMHYGHAAIEDNSMFLEEAFNQGAGVVQCISGTFVMGRVLETSVEVEIPLAGERHQLSVGSSYVLNYSNKEMPEGFGDVRVSYRPKLSGKQHWAMIIPRLTITIPRKNAPDEFVYTKPEIELGLAITKRVSSVFTSHINAATAYRFGNTGKRSAYTFAGSVIWAIRPKFNFMLESTHHTSKNEMGQRQGETIANPAFRFSFSAGHYQVIPGIGSPVCIGADSGVTSGLFVYLSIEPF